MRAWVWMGALLITASVGALGASMVMVADMSPRGEPFTPILALTGYLLGVAGAVAFVFVYCARPGDEE